MRQNERLTPSKVGANALLALLSVFFFFPFYWIVTGAFKIQNVAIQVPPEWFPLHPTMQNFADLSKSPVIRWTFNSFVIALGTTFLACVAASMGGYALAKKRFPGRDIIFGLFIAAMSLPKQVIMISLFAMLANWKWINTYQALILPAAAWPFGIFLMRQFSQPLPLGISALQAEFTTNYGMLMAGAAIASVPMIIIFIAFQKYFTQGITMGAVKG